MILVKEYINIDIVVENLLHNPKNIWNLWKDDNEIKSTLRIQQKGAGNGKTFGIWKSISLNFDKDLYIIVTKQHTAKEVIKNELDEQAERNEFHISDNMIEILDSKYGKQLIVEYTHKYSKRECFVIIGTIDSFIYNISESNNTNSNFFEGLLDNIIQNGCTKIKNRR